MQGSQIGKQRIIIAGHAHRHGGEEFHRKQQREVAGGNVGQIAGIGNFACAMDGETFVVATGPDFPAVFAGDE